jgi:hypothetical protein
MNSVQGAARGRVQPDECRECNFTDMQALG